MSRLTKALSIGIFCLLGPFIIGFVRDYAIPLGSNSFLDNWSVFPLFSTILFIAVYPVYGDSGAWSRNSGVIAAGIVGGIIGLLLYGIAGLAFGAILSSVACAILTVSLTRMEASDDA